MEEKVINNLSCREITNIKRVYYVWYDNYLSVEKLKREELWRINKLNLKPDILPMLFNVDVDEWNWDESGDKTSNGGLFERQLKGFVPKLNEWAESYFNEMLRRPMCIFIETFDESVYLFGGESPRTTFTFTKSISSRNGYDLVFTCLSEESSLIINDEEFFPAPLDTGLTCEPVTINLDGTDILIADSGSIVTINLEDTDENPVIPDDVQIVGDNIKLVFPVAAAPTYDLDLVDRFGNAFPTKQVTANATWDLKTLTPFDFADIFLNQLTAPSATIQAAIIDLVDDLNAAGLWDEFYTIHPLVNGNANDHALNLKYPFRKSSANLARFQGSPTHNANGLTTNGSNNAMIIPLIPDQFANGGDRFAVSVYSRTDGASGGTLNADIGGVSFSQFEITRIIIRTSANYQDAAMGGVSGVFSNSSYTGSSLGLFTTYLGAATDGLARNGVNLSGSNAKSPTQQPTNFSAICVGAQWSGQNAPQWYTARNYAYAASMKAWSLAQEVDHYNAVQNFQTTLGRQV